MKGKEDKAICANPGLCLSFLKSACDLVYLRHNRDAMEILRNLIGCLRGWNLVHPGQIKIQESYINLPQSPNKMVP